MQPYISYIDVKFDRTLKFGSRKVEFIEKYTLKLRMVIEMKKGLFSALLTLCLILVMLPMQAQAAASGTCGDNLTWSLDSWGTMTISGSGEMWKDYTSPSDIPWYDSISKTKKVVVEDGVTSVWGDVFTYNNSLTSVTIGSSVTDLGTEPFYGCGSLTDFLVDSGNTVYSSVDGVLFNKDQTALLLYPSGKKGAYSVPNGAGISAYAFTACNGLTRVTIPDGTSAILRYTFAYCEGLTSVVIPDSVTLIADAFQGCTRLTDVYYSGSEAQWNEINIISDGNECLTGATIHYNSAPEPDDDQSSAIADQYLEQEIASTDEETTATDEGAAVPDDETISTDEGTVRRDEWTGHVPVTAVVGVAVILAVLAALLVIKRKKRV